jgi:hypothetical protein
MSRDGRSKNMVIDRPPGAPEGWEDPFLDPERRVRHERAQRIQKEAETWEALAGKITKIICSLEIEFDDEEERRDFYEAWFAAPFIQLESRARECAAISVRNVTDYRRHILFQEMYILDLAIRYLRASMKAAIDKELGSRDKWSDKDINIELGNETEPVALCACGAAAVQWRKDTPVCGNPECLAKATFGGK